MPTPQPILGGHYDGCLTDGTVEYQRIMNGSYWRSEAKDSYNLVPTNGKFEGFFFELSAAPGAGTTWTFTISEKDAGVLGTCTISDTDTTGEIVGDIELSAGDLIYITMQATTGTPAWAGLRWGTVWIPDIDDEFIWMGCTDDWAHNTNTEYNPITANPGSWGTAGSKFSMCSATVTFKKLGVWIDRSPGAGNSYDFDIYKTASKQSLGVTIDTSNYSAPVFDNVNTFIAYQGNYLNIGYIPFDYPTTFNNSAWGVVYVPNNTCMIMITGGTSDNINDTNTEYNKIWGGTSWNTWRGAMYSLIREGFTMTNFYVKLVANPDNGVGTQSLTLTIEDGWGVDTDLTVTIEETSTTGNDQVNSHGVDVGDYLFMQVTPAGTPKNYCDAFWGIRCLTVAREDDAGVVAFPALLVMIKAGIL